MEAAIRFSINSLPGQADQHFLKIDVANRVLQLYNVKSEAKDGLEYELVYASGKLDSFKAFDWHPREASLVAVGHDIRGEARLVDLAHPNDTAITFNAKNSRPCNAVGLNTQNLFAAGHTRIRSDFCLNVWDLNQRISKGHGKASEPLHKLAMNEAVTSLRFFHGQPQLLAAGVKEQFVRLYDLREQPSTFALQFATKCVNNIAIDNKDENFFASCLPSNHPTVSIWDRRMISRNSNPHMGFGAYISQADQHPEPSLELKHLVDPKDSIWGLRFSKTKRGHLGVLSSTGQLSYIKFDVADEYFDVGVKPQEGNWEMQKPKAIFLDDARHVFKAWDERSAIQAEQRVISFDFTTDTNTATEARVITLTGDGVIRVSHVKTPGNAYAITNHGHLVRGNGPKISGGLKTSKLAVSELKLKDNNTQKPSYLQNIRQLSTQGYLLDADINYAVVQDERLKALWMWLKHAKQISAAKALVQSNLDFSFLGIFAFWMEEVAVRSRANHEFNSGVRVSATIKELTRRLGLARGKGCPTEYPQNRALCLHVLGLAYNQSDIRIECDNSVQAGDHTKAAAIALFAGEEKIAQQTLRAKGSGDSHKMLAMALLGARNRHRRMRRMSHGSEKSQSQDDGSEDDGSQDEEWKDIVTAVAEDLNDCYARAILAFVKTGSWEDVISQECLPLNYRIGIALRHLGDSRLTRYLSTLKQAVTQKGDLEGIVITGIGTTEGTHLLQTYATRTGDLQTAALAMNFEAASDRYLASPSPEMRTVYVYRETYKRQLMSLRLKHEKVRFVVALSRAIRESGALTETRKKEQIRLICTHCNQSTAIFGHEQQAMQSAHITETVRNVLAPEKAAVAGVVCPKCGRHLPRCGVCDLWLGIPDESFSKWYRPPQAVDLSASMAGSTVTAIGPGGEPPTISVTKAEKEKSKISTADLIPEPVEVVDEDRSQVQAEKKWYDAMHKFTIFCTMCSHGFHAEHAKMWFDGMGGHGKHKTCPVSLCECMCNI